MGARKRGSASGPKASSAVVVPEAQTPSDDPEVLRQLHAENLRKAGEVLRALKLPNDLEPCVVFKA